MYSILAGQSIIGHTEFEHGDPPMGVAFGQMLPSPAFAAFRTSHAPDLGEAGETSWGNLSARSDSGVLLDCADVVIVVHDLDAAPEDGAPGIEVTAYGIAWQQFETLFPEHVAAHDHRFGSAS
ncbi:hypothetical protein [Stagnihabitans tardus]|uniref:Uncharacterized protein n=1 Tax=Stagnihabitans tardus TaxID=2699202 RepID=A0AAE4Y7N8_9RHOB|nr:hypothetical protein [Stagnihabitans tardus]NBZ87391.1 hypothetical protein [Stagnihabitans tardus]